MEIMLFESVQYILKALYSHKIFKTVILKLSFVIVQCSFIFSCSDRKHC